MSEDKKRDRALQRRVRERQEKTGEGYQAAWRQLTDSEDPSSGGLEPKHSSVNGAPSHTRRVPLPLSTGVKVLPGQSAQLTARPQIEAFWPERFLIKNAEHWDVHKLTTRNDRDREVSLITTGSRVDSGFSLDVWRPLATREVLCGEEIVAVVTYVGQNEQGETFEATLFGSEEECPLTTTRDHPEVDSSERISERAESKNVSACESVRLPLTIKAPVLFVDRLTIANAKDWIVNDIKIRGRSIFVQAGDLPGDMFSASATVILERLAADERVEILATYVGLEKTSRLVVELSGTAKPTNHPVSYFLPLSTGVPIEPTQSAQITGRPQRRFLPERLVIADADSWIVNDLKVGTKSQFVQSGDIPGQSFSSSTVGGHVTLDPVHPGQDFILITTRVADYKGPFFCGVQGRLVHAHRAETGTNKNASPQRAPSSDAPPGAEFEADDECFDSSSRLVIRLDLPLVPPHQPTRITARAAEGAVDIKEIFIMTAGSTGWIVNDIEIDGRSQLARKDLPGELFTWQGIASAKQASTKLSLKGFDPVERDREIALIVTYVGPNPEGLPFHASIMGTKPHQRPTIVPVSSKVPVLPTAAAAIVVHVQNAPFQMTRLAISNEGTLGGAADWIVNDLHINGQSQFVHSGDVPGDLFATEAIDTFLKLEECKAGGTILLDVTYIGLNDDGAIFSACLEGTVVRDDYRVSPPDLHVLVEAATVGREGTRIEGSEDVVIARCNWRSPASDNSTR